MVQEYGRYFGMATCCLHYPQFEIKNSLQDTIKQIVPDWSITILFLVFIGTANCMASLVTSLEISKYTIYGEGNFNF